MKIMKCKGHYHIRLKKTKYYYSPLNKQNITISEFINISGDNVKVVTEFKLFGIIIDNKLNFKSNTAKIKRSINIRLYSLQKLFQLPLAVKIQFLFISSFYPIHLKILTNGIPYLNNTV